MNKFLLAFKNSKEYFATVLLILYAIGYLNLKIYYSGFNIQIESYMTISEYLFAAISYFINIVVGFFAIEFLYLTMSHLLSFYFYIFYINLKKRKINIRLAFRLAAKFFESKYAIYSLIFNFILVISITILDSKLFYKFSNSILNIVLFLILYFTIKLTLVSIKFKKSDSYILLLYSLILIIYGILISGFTNKLGIVKDGYFGKKFDIEFVIDNLSYSTIDNNYRYIGETSQYLFIYDFKCKNTLVFLKENIKDYKIK